VRVREINQRGKIGNMGAIKTTRNWIGKKGVEIIGPDAESAVHRSVHRVAVPDGVPRAKNEELTQVGSGTVPGPHH
jgi:hypothetical protein